jgi:ubiquinone/menaquinone biosynthesis C-methylase UbiE/uncharacterized protein YbaR (Trm112 family)
VNRQNDPQKKRRMTRFGWFFLAMGIGFAVLRIVTAFFRRPAQVRPSRPARPAAAVLDLLACPLCGGGLILAGNRQAGQLICQECQKIYPIVNSIPRFAPYQELSGFNRRFAGLYDWFSLVYRPFSKLAFAYIGTSEDKARRAMINQLEPYGRVLEVSIGPGVNLPYLFEYPDVREVYGLDLSNGQLACCHSYARRNGWPVSLYQGNAESLPFHDHAFDSILHIGGINFFNDQAKAICEMIRVAKPGAKITLCDETERAARGYERALPGFNLSFKGQRAPVRPPLDLLPPDMEDVVLDETAWDGWFYCLSFRKPAR